jgi:hypothetical protein
MRDRRGRARFLIQLERPGATLGMAEVLEALRGTGVELDPTYGVILVNPDRGRYVVRGYATPDARARAERLDGVTLFADARIESVTNGD